jgi:dihydroorotate dehydrogenase (fumarate)
MMIDLTTEYLGLRLANPLVVSACPLTGDLTTLQHLEAAGAAAVVMPSLFEEQIEQADAALFPQASTVSATNSVNMDGYNMGPDGCLRHLELAKKTVSVPVIGSLNGTSRGGCVRFARLIEQAGADALELNLLYIPTDVLTTTAEVEDRYVEVVATVRESISIPVAVKIGPYFAALPHFAKRLTDAGANGLVLFNRFLEPEFDVDAFEVRPHVEFSRQSELRLPLRWIAILRDQLDISFALTSGIHDARDLAKALLAGADVAMIASSLFRYGPDHIETLLDGLRRWLESHDRACIDQVKGLMSRKNYFDPTAFERANYLQAMSSFVATFE